MDDKYAEAGVSIDVADSIKDEVKQLAHASFTSGVLAGPGLFGGMFELKGYKNPVLVSSVDGVGTKLKLAVTMDSYDSVGMDIVNHSVNDILTCGATPLFFLDYIAMGQLLPEKIRDVVKGLSSACQEVGCALIGGETAEMPGLYAGADFDLVGTIVGVVEKDSIINGREITSGDIILGLPSSGLHTNGYSLARHVLGEDLQSLNKFYPELGQTLWQALLVPHKCYFKELKPLLSLIKGLAHITGGGFSGNVPRIMPENFTAHFDTSAWDVPPIFKLIQERGQITKDEMYRVFNMGIGMVIIASPETADELRRCLPNVIQIGRITPLQCKQRVILD
ncbi:MAG: phosphoribosylformylglycinamidine cyclo-ligase [Dehalococcoidia bacterium]|nr:phosphoribosylformylglycinamidine cyclo-ligase [Dehalococcoidia bacterium]